MNFKGRLAHTTKILPALVCLCLAPIYVRPQDEPEPSGAPVSLNKCWDAETAEPVDGAIASDSERIYIPLTGGGVQAINVKDGSSVWSADLGGELGSRILVNGRALYIVSLVNGAGSNKTAVLRSVSKQTGVTNWRVTMPGSNRFFLGEAAGGLVVISERGQIEFRSADDGNVTWRSIITGAVTSEPFFMGDKIFAGTSHKALYVLSSADGRIVARKTLKFVPTAVSATADGRIITGDERGNLVLRDQDGDPQWNFKNGARISTVGHTRHGILAVSLDNFVYLLSNDTGNVIWKRRLPGRVFGQPAVAGDIVVATTVADGRAFVIDIENGKLVNQLAIDNADNGGLQPLLISDHIIAFSLPGEVSAYSSRACS